MADIIITKDDLKDPAIDDVVNLQRSLQPQGGERIEDIKTPFYYNPIFYYSVASSIGALLVWAVSEHYMHDEDKPSQIPFFSDYMLFGPIAAVMGLSIGLVYGFVNRNIVMALYCGAIGVGVGLGASVLTVFIAEKVFLVAGIAAAIVATSGGRQLGPNEGLHGMAFFIFMCGRGLAWSIVSMSSGIGLGIALKSKRLALNGFVGSMIGGLIGGLLFDPLHRFVTPDASVAWMSRAVGTLFVGFSVGLLIGVFENASKEAWFLMLKGPLAGKQFIIFKSPMKIGSSPKSEVYLFKDSNIAPLHASVTKSGSKYLLSDEKSDAGTFVNGRKVDKYILQPGDTITIGEAVLRYSEKSKG